MKIHNVRIGFATNSSSKHSMIFVDSKINDNDCEGAEFGWQNFTAASKEAKSLYLTILLQNSMQEMEMPEHISQLILKDWVGIELSDNEKYGNIDHQSALLVPSEFGTRVPDKEFFIDLKNFILQDGLVILGGNDNDDKQHPLAEKFGENFIIESTTDMYGSCICRKDSSGFWTIFDKGNGNKIRLSFTGKRGTPEIVTPEKAYAPELVDLKITDFCSHNCGYCYQDSGPKGKHAKMFDLYNLADVFKELKIFEVALGGGETMAHPKIKEIIEIFYRNGVTVNFSTRSTDWMRNQKELFEIYNMCGAFAYSTKGVYEVREFADIVNYNKLNRNKISLHLVMGTLTMWELRAILNIASDNGIGVTLLDFKRTGRGRGYPIIDYSNFLKEVVVPLREDGDLPYLGFDTPLVIRFKDELEAMGIPEYLYSLHEGDFSCYIDAVSKKVGPCSYCREEDMVDFPEGTNYISSEELAELFSKF